MKTSFKNEVLELLIQSIKESKFPMTHISVQTEVKTLFKLNSFFSINSNNLPTPKFTSAANNSKSTNLKFFFRLSPPTGE